MDNISDIKKDMKSYIYDCEISYNPSDKNESIELRREFVKYILVSSDYLNTIMPVIYIKITLSHEIYKQMIYDQGGKGKIYLNVYKHNDDTNQISTVSNASIYGEFDYYMADDPEYDKKLIIKNEEKNNISFRQCILGLTKLEYQQINRNVRFEGIYKNTTTMSLIKMATSKIPKIVIQPFEKNLQFGTFVCPPIPSIAQFIDYINRKASFYKGQVMYFMDFDKTYLRSCDGEYIETKDDDDIQQIIFRSIPIDDDINLLRRIKKDPDNKSYIIYVAGSEINITLNRASSSLINNIDSINTKNGSTLNSKLNTENITNADPKIGGNLTVVSSDINGAQNITEILSESTVSLSVSKVGVDSLIFKPNKEYILDNYDKNPIYNGRYYLVKKDELYMRTGSNIVYQVAMTLNKCSSSVSSNIE